MRYEAPDTVETAAALLAGATGEARVLAGGTDLLVQMRSDIVDPALIVDIKKIAETRIITEATTTDWVVETPTPCVPPVVRSPMKQPTVDRISPKANGLERPMIRSFSASAWPIERQ